MLGVFRDIFDRFLIEEANGTKSAYYILTNDGASSHCAVIVDDKMYQIDQPGDLAGYAYMKIMESALSKVLSHCLFHAAALSFNGQGVIFPAASKSGKTTLTLELVKRGFKFLSDDISAISRSDHLIHPFPKRLGMLPYTLELCPEAELDSLKMLPMIGGGEKKLLDIDDFYPGSIGKPCRLR